MIKNFFKIAYRIILRNKGFSFINISGLAIGMASAVLILLWIQNEMGQALKAAIANSVKSLRSE
jgi:putative ABC transport system permease protein